MTTTRPWVSVFSETVEEAEALGIRLGFYRDQFQPYAADDPAAFEGSRSHRAIIQFGMLLDEHLFQNIVNTVEIRYDGEIVTVEVYR